MIVNLNPGVRENTSAAYRDNKALRAVYRFHDSGNN